MTDPGPASNQSTGLSPADPPADPPPQTGDRVVDAELRLVADAARRPVDEHVEVYARAQRTLQDRLSDLDG